MIWPLEVTLIRWTQPSGPLCLWQCLQIILHSREDDATLSVRCVPKSVYLDSRKVFYFDISFNFTPFHASCWTWNEKNTNKAHLVWGTFLHRCLTQVVPRCSDGFIGNRIAKLILKKKITEDKLIQSAILLKKCPQEGGPFDQAGQWSTSCEGQPQYGGAGSDHADDN